MNKKTKLILFIITILCLTSLSFSIYKIIKWKIDTNKTNNQIEIIEDKIEIEEIEDNENTEVIKQTEEIPKSNPYFDYINMNLLNVDFRELKSINSDVKPSLSSITNVLKLSFFVLLKRFIYS